MNWTLINAIALLLIPPGCLLLLAGIGWVLAFRRPRLGKSLIWLALIALYLLSTQYVSDRLLQALEPVPDNPLASHGVQAIVVLGGGTYFAAPEYGTDTVKPETLARLRYAAQLHRASGKPILVTGGNPEGNSIAEAVLMKAVLNRDFQVPVAWIEGKSDNTLENARLSRLMLDAAGIRRIWLVTHAWHMPRAKMAFENAGFGVVPAPTEFATSYKLSVLSFLPRAEALRNSSRFFHEVIGIAWYRLKFLAGR
ncbi:MAG: YdcF family protein [Burkholderiales bacterium]|nr:YdcF family protein [Burkholderiales bacterium]